MADGTYAGNLWIFRSNTYGWFRFYTGNVFSDTGLTSLLLNDTLLSISTSGPVELTYNEADRTVDVTAEAPTDVNLLMTKNDVNESWPWHSWALDTTGTTTLHADLDDDGLHLSGDGITNAKYATENADTENVDSGTISVQPDADGITAVTITNKNPAPVTPSRSSRPPLPPPEMPSPSRTASLTSMTRSSPSTALLSAMSSPSWPMTALPRERPSPAGS